MGEGEGGISERSRPRPLIAIYHANAAHLDSLAAFVVAAGYRVCRLTPPAAGLRAWLNTPFDMLMLNPFLGWQDPAQMIAMARSIAARRPMLIVSDADAFEDRMLGLRGGADDAMGWMGRGEEIVARIAGLLRRNRQAAGQIACDELVIDLIDRRVVRAGHLIRMPLREFDLLANLARAPDRPFSSDSLLRAVWRVDFDPGTNRVAVHMSRLRAKIDRGFAWPMLMTIKGKGYVLRSRRVSQ